MREPEKHGDWAGGPGREAFYQLNQLLIQDWQDAGGDPFFGGRLKSLLVETGFGRVEAEPSFSPALSSTHVCGAFARRRLQEPEFVGRAISGGLISHDRLQKLAQEIEVWARGETSLAAFSECIALGWKPAP